jgi:hypothetical protein
MIFMAVFPISVLAFYSCSSWTTHLLPRFLPFPTAPLCKLDPMAFERAIEINVQAYLIHRKHRPIWKFGRSIT